MQVIYSDKHKLRGRVMELSAGELVPCFEKPERIDHILARLGAVGWTDIAPPETFGLDPVRRVHQEDYLDFLATVHPRWLAAGHKGEAMCTTWPSRRMWSARIPQEIEGQCGWYALTGETAIDAGMWEAAQASADVALTATRRVADGARAAFALCRPPGHHAAQDMYGGYCFLNNAAIAAQWLRDQGMARVAILDVDFHHGNGGQAIFWDRADVLFLSIHGDPAHAFPNFLGYAEETGAGAGEGFNVNYPLPPGTPYGPWAEALADAMRRIADFGAEAVVVSLGVDTFERDPISFFKLRSDDFTDYGRRLAGMGLPTVFIMEGGYAVAEIGVNTVNVLQGFEAAA